MKRYLSTAINTMEKEEKNTQLASVVPNNLQGISYNDNAVQGYQHVV
jgi:hypothetical protein